MIHVSLSKLTSSLFQSWPAQDMRDKKNEVASAILFNIISYKGTKYNRIMRQDTKKTMSQSHRDDEILMRFLISCQSLLVLEFARI